MEQIKPIKPIIEFSLDNTFEGEKALIYKLHTGMLTYRVKVLNESCFNCIHSYCDGNLFCNHQECNTRQAPAGNMVDKNGICNKYKKEQS